MKFARPSRLTMDVTRGCRLRGAAAAVSAGCMVPNGRRTRILREASRGSMSRSASSGLVMIALLAALASAPAARAAAAAATANPAQVVTRSAPRSTTASHAVRRIHHRHTHLHHRPAVLGARSVTAAGATSRQLPPAAPAPHPHRATLPNVGHSGHGPRTLRDGTSFSAVSEPVVPVALAVRDLRGEMNSIPNLWLDPVRSGRGPPRAGPLRHTPALNRPALAGLVPDASLLAPPSVSPFPTPSLPAPTRLELSAIAAASRPAPHSTLPHIPRPVFGRLLARRPEGTAARLFMPS